MSKQRISLRDEEGRIIHSITVDNFTIKNIPKDWDVEHNYSIWFEDEDQWGFED